MSDLFDGQAALLAPGAIDAAAPLLGPHSDTSAVTFWLVRTVGGTGLRPPTSEYYTVRGSTIATRATDSGGASTMYERLLVEADESGIQALERALNESGAVQSVEYVPAPDGDYIDKAHGSIVTLRGGQIVED